MTSMLNRREFARCATACAALAAPGWALAQGGPVEGRDFMKLDKPLPVTPGGKVEVVEFFGYWCPHCNAFEPTLEGWARQVPKDKVDFRRISVAFNAAQEPLQRMFFAIETLGLIDALHRKVFEAIHATRKLPPSPRESDLEAFLKDNGADAPKVLETMKSFGVATKIRQARQLAEGYGLDAVPTLGVQGRWRTSPSMAGSPQRALAVVESLIAQARKG